jgi:hypothetical protein
MTQLSIGLAGEKLMQEQIGDIWAARKLGDWVVVTTNSTIRQDGALVMGRGIAFEAAKRYPLLQKRCGELVRQNGLRVEFIPDTFAHNLIIFPVKHHFKEEADINLILRSTIQLVAASDFIREGRILMPRPGCGWGHLDWLEVRPLLLKYLNDDRFIIFHKKEGGPRRGN